MVYGQGAVLHDSRSRGVIQGSFLGGRPALPPSRSGCAPPCGRAQAFAPPPGFRLPPPAAGRPLPGPVQAALGGLLRTDLAGVRVHVGGEAVTLRALAFSLGPELFFAPGQYSPETRAGLRLLGHELAHVLQQKRGQVRNPFPAGLAIVHDPALEAEATRIGLRAESLLAARPVQVAVPPSFRVSPRGPVATAVQSMEQQKSGKNKKRRRQRQVSDSPASHQQSRQPGAPTTYEELLREATFAPLLLSFLNAPDRLRLRGVCTSARTLVDTQYDPFAKARRLGSARTDHRGGSSERITKLARRAWAAIYWTLYAKRRRIPAYEEKDNRQAFFARIEKEEYWKVTAYAPFERESGPEPIHSINELPEDDPEARDLVLGEGRKWESHYRKTPFLHAEIRLAELKELEGLTLPKGERLQVNKPCCLFCAGLLEAIGLSGRYPGARLHSHKRYVFTKYVLYFRDRRRLFWGDFETLFDSLAANEKQQVLVQLAGFEVSSDTADQVARVWQLEQIPEAEEIREESETPPIPTSPVTRPLNPQRGARRSGFQVPRPSGKRKRDPEPGTVSAGVDQERLGYIVSEATKTVGKLLEQHGTWDFGSTGGLVSLVESTAESLLRSNPHTGDDDLASLVAKRVYKALTSSSD